MAWGLAADLENASLFSTVTLYPIIPIRLPAPPPTFSLCMAVSWKMTPWFTSDAATTLKEEHTNIEQREGKHIDNVFCGVQVSGPLLLH